jgi:hypothetical protein
MRLHPDIVLYYEVRAQSAKYANRLLRQNSNYDNWHCNKRDLIPQTGNCGNQ